MLRAQAERKPENRIDTIVDIQNTRTEDVDAGGVASLKECSEDDTTDSFMASDSENLSDIFETDSDSEREEKADRPLYVDTFEKFPVENDEETKDFEEELRQISGGSQNGILMGKDVSSPNFDEVDQIFLRAASLLKKQKR